MVLFLQPRQYITFMNKYLTEVTHEQYSQHKWRHIRRCLTKDTESKNTIHYVEKNLEGKQIKVNTKPRIFKLNAKAVLLYGSDQSLQKTLTRIQAIHQHMPARNPTPDVVRQGIQHDTLGMDQTTTCTHKNMK